MLWLIRADLITVLYKEHISFSLGSVDKQESFQSTEHTPAMHTATPELGAPRDFPSQGDFPVLCELNKVRDRWEIPLDEI